MARSNFFNRLALRISAAVSATVFVGGWALGVLLSEPSPVISLLMALIAGGAAYGATFAIVARRIELARESLRQSRKRSFGALNSLSSESARDELDELVYQSYRLGRTLQQEIERLERLEHYRREYLGDVSHELRTPIFAVSGFAETLLDGALDDEMVRRSFIEKIQTNARRLDSLTRDLAEIAHIETGEVRMKMEPFDLGPLVQETAEALELVAKGRSIKLSIQIPKALPRVFGDRNRIRQVVANLVENAIKYNEPGGHVEVMARVLPTESVRVAIVDDGIGIPPEAISRLTERFFRVDKSRSREQGGTGLGLAIVKHILEAHSERLHIESRLEYGSKFAFELPVAEAQDYPEGPHFQERSAPLK